MSGIGCDANDPLLHRSKHGVATRREIARVSCMHPHGGHPTEHAPNAAGPRNKDRASRIHRKRPNVGAVTPKRDRLPRNEVNPCRRPGECQPDDPAEPQPLHHLVSSSSQSDPHAHGEEQGACRLSDCESPTQRPAVTLRSHAVERSRLFLLDGPKPLAKNPSMPMTKGLALLAFGLFALALACAPATGAFGADGTDPSPRPETAVPPRDVPSALTAPEARTPVPDNVRARIRELEAAVAADEEAIKTMISDPQRAQTLRTDPELLAIADRLPALQRELRKLRTAYPGFDAHDGQPDAHPGGNDAP